MSVIGNNVGVVAGHDPGHDYMGVYIGVNPVVEGVTMAFTVLKDGRSIKFEDLEQSDLSLCVLTCETGRKFFMDAAKKMQAVYDVLKSAKGGNQ